MKGITPNSKSSKSSGEVVITIINYISNYIVNVVIITVDCNNRSMLRTIGLRVYFAICSLSKQKAPYCTPHSPPAWPDSLSGVGCCINFLGRVFSLGSGSPLMLS